MTHAIQDFQEQPQVTVDDADHMMRSWPDLLTSPIRDRAELDLISKGYSMVTLPARHAWIMARVAALLSQYYAADVSQGAVRMMAEDWASELSDYPEWAITKAVRWWKSRENADRKRRPLEGDISARARIEMGPVFVAESAMRRFGSKPKAASSSPRENATPEQKAAADALVAQFAKRAGQAAKEAME